MLFSAKASTRSKTWLWLMYHEVVKLFDYYCILLIATTASHVSNTEDNSTPQKL